MGLLLPVCFIAVASYGFLRHPRSPVRGDPLTAFPVALLSAWLWTAVSTEALSVFRLLTPWGVIVAWGAMLLAAAGVAGAATRGNARTGKDTGHGTVWILWGPTLAIMLVLLVVAVAAAPTTWDSMSYHLARVAHWIQNRSVAHYATPELRQLQMNPLAEFDVLHVMLLTGSDRFVNLVQWTCTAGFVVTAAAIARCLGGNRKGQALAALLAATVPMGILQASSTQNDAVAAFLLGMAMLALLRLRQRANGFDAGAFGVSVGLALLTKGTAYLFAAPLGLAFVWTLLSARALSWPRRIATVAVPSLAMLLLNAGHYARNWRLFGSPLGVNDATYPNFYVNEIFGLRVLVSNCIRNTALHFQTPWPAVARWIGDSVTRVHGLIGLAVDDPRTTFAAMGFGPGVFLHPTHEAYAGGPLHLVLLVAAVVCIMLRRGKEPEQRGRRTQAAWYLVYLLIAGVCFCGYLKWQPWQSRLQLPLFVLACPWIAVLLVRCVPRSVTWGIAVLAVVLALPLLFENATRPLVGRRSVLRLPRTAQYFTERPQLMKPYASTVVELVDSGARRIGLRMKGDDWEYPLWRLARQCDSAFEFHHVDVDNISASLQTVTAAECDAVVEMDNTRGVLRVE